MFICASTVYMYFCNLSTKLNVPPLVATNLLNHFEDFVKTPLSHVSHWPVLCSYRLPLTRTTRSWNSLRTNILHTQQEIFWRCFNIWNTGSLNPLSSRNLSWSTTRAPTAISTSNWSTWTFPCSFILNLTCGSEFLSCKDNPLLPTRFREPDFVYLLNWDGHSVRR